MYQAVETDPMLGSVRSPRVDKPGATGSGSIRTMRLEAPTRRCNDVLFAILFIANVLTVAVFAFWKGIPALVKQAKELAADDTTATNVPEAPDGDFTKVFALAAALVAISIGVSAFWMKFLMAYATQLIRIALWLNVVLIVIFAIVGFSVQPIMSAIMLAVAGLNVWFIFAVSSRIAFAAANLKSACAAVGEHMGVFWVALFMIIKQFAWLMLWSLCAIGVYQHFKDVDPECDKAEAAGQDAPSHFCGGTSGGLALFFLLISVYWGQQVIQNVLTCTTAGVVATWWYQPESKKVTFGAFYRSLTTSFGSICFGSLIVAILHALRSMASILKEKAREDDNVALACVACMAECVLNCIESIMEYINQWAYVYVGIYGYDFRTSGKAVTDLFVNRGFTAVINDDLTQTALTIGAFGVGFVGLVVGLVMVQFSPPSWFAALGDKQSAFAVLGTIGFLSGIGMAMVLANVIITALHTVFVCFAEDPIALSRNHPQEYETLVNGWRQFHGEALQGAYGSAV